MNKDQIVEALYNMLPLGIKRWRNHCLAGRLLKGSEIGRFVLDTGLLGSLPVDSYSQCGQDVFAYYFLFQQKRDGVFLDIGANDPVNGSNSYLLEQHGWTGLAFEPIKHIADSWKGVRSTECINIALGAQEREVTLVELEADKHSFIGADSSDGKNTVKVQQRTLADVLKEREISNVDFVSIDVEGYEMNVLKGINFDAVDIKCFCIENNRKGSMKADDRLRKFLLAKGYHLVARLTIDDVFMKL